MSLYTRGNSVCRGSYPVVTNRLIISSRFRPNQCHFHHLQFDAWDWVGFHTSQFTFADPQMDRVFATPSVILRSAGSVGMALIMWLLGAAVAATGSAVYLEYGTVSALLPSGVIMH